MYIHMCSPKNMPFINGLVLLMCVILKSIDTLYIYIHIHVEVDGL